MSDGRQPGCVPTAKATETPMPRSRPLSLWLLPLALGLGGFPVPAPAESEAQLGRRLYELGIDRNGRPVQAHAPGGLVYEGEQATCLRCHRRSGFGGSEGGYYVPPITAGFLFEPSRHDRNDRFRAAFLEAQSTQHWIRARMPRSRPAYSDETLRAAIRDGHNPAGTVFDPLMPRYRIDDPDLANLSAYLRTLSRDISPGVDARYLHLATVVGPGVDPGEREAMLETTRAFVQWYNERLRGDLRHRASTRAYGMQFRSSTRLWKLHVWELHGESGSWVEQLRRYGNEQPVFAMVNGLVRGSWAPLARFCDSERLPCLFPLTELPENGRALGGYTVYYSRGLELEADLLGQYLAQRPERPGELVQIHHAGPAGRLPAERFARHAAERLPDTPVRTIAFHDPAEIADALDRLGRDGRPPGGLVVWPGGEFDALETVLSDPAATEVPIYTCSRALEAARAGQAGPNAQAWAHRLTVAWPYSLPDARSADAYRVRGWLRSRGLSAGHERVRFMSYYGLGILRDALRHMFEHFHRDYLIERVEHEVDGAQNPGFYPTLALGPEQRILSKGGYVARLEGRGSGRLVPVSGWMVP